MKNYFIVICFALLISSCDTPQCKNSNPIFDKNTPESKAYQDELIQQLKTTDNSGLIYTLENYIEKEGTAFLYVRVQNDSLCATAVVKVTDWDVKLEDIHRTKGKGYHGAELKNLQLQIVQDSLKTELLYKDIEAIID